ncbi:hypothetical protein [Brevibacillus laterosporus]|uniref:hypothetical protein n=1 Tax=Brevibacillus laterosporus TaxID=1465 RepID=UPI003D235404
MFKKFSVFFLTLSVLGVTMFSGAGGSIIPSVHAKEKDSIESLGLTDEELSFFPEEVLEKLIEQNAVKKSSFIKSFDLESEENKEGVSTFSLTDDDITLAGVAFKVDSDRRGYKKFYLHGAFDWNINPFNKWTDKISIGYPVTTKFFLPMSKKGKVQEHENKLLIRGIGEKWREQDYSTTPSDWEAGAGVAAEIDIVRGNYDQKGYIGQYVYVDEDEKGTTNIKIRYGHSKMSGSPGVSIYPVGLAVSPSWDVETLDFGLELKY